MRRVLNIAAAVVVLAWIVVAGLDVFRRPFYGFTIGPAGYVTSVDAGARVQPGDRILVTNGRPVVETVDALEMLARPGGGPLTLQVRRGDRTLQVVQPPVPAPAHLYVHQLGAAALALLFLGMGLFVALRPTGKPGQLFFLFCLAVALQLVGPAEDVGGGAGLAIQLSILWGSLLLGAVAFLHFFLLFPHEHPLAARYPWLQGAIYVPPAAFFLLLEGVLFASRAGFAPQLFVNTLGRAALLVGVAYFLWAVLTFVDSYRRLENALEREKLRWLVWGVVISVVPVLLLLVLESVGARVPHHQTLILLLLLFLPVSFGYAILSHRLMDIEIVLNRGLVYTVITVILLVVFIAVENLLAELSLEITGQSSFALAMSAAIVMAALVEPIKRRVQLFIDRLFFAYKAKLREGLKDLSEELSFITDLERMEQLLLRRLVDLAHVSRAALFLPEEEGDGYALAEWVGRAGRGGDGAVLDARPRFDANDSFVVWLLREGRPISLESLPEADFHQRMESREVEILRALDAALCLPLRLRGELTGFLFLSRRLNRELFNSDEIELLYGLAIQAATDLTNARLQTRSRRLEEEITSLREDVVAALRAILAGPSAANLGGLLERLEPAPGEGPGRSGAD